MLEQLLADLFGLRLVLVDLVDRHDDRNAGRLGVVDRFDRLRHDAVVSGNHEDRDIGGLRTACTHRREGGVAGGVDEGDLLAVMLDLIGTDMLRDAAGFAADHVGIADGVEQRGLAVVDMAHDGDDRRARLHGGFIVLDIEDAGFNVRFRDALDGMAEFRRDEFCKVGVDDVARLHHLAFLHQVLDDVDGAFGHALRQFLNGDGFRQDDFAHDLFARFLHLAAAELLLTAAHGGHRTATLRTIFVERRVQRQLALTAAIVGLRTGGNLGGSRTGHLAARRTGAGTTTVFFFVVSTATATRCTGCRHGCAGVGTRSGRIGLRRTAHLDTTGRLCGARSGSNGCRGFFGLDDRLLNLGLERFFAGTGFGLEALALQTFSLFNLATGFLFGALLGFFRIADLRFGERAAARFHLAGGEVVEHGDGTRASLRRRGHRLLGARLRFRLARRGGRLRLLYGCDYFFVFRAVDATLARFNHNGFGATPTHVLADGPLREAGGLQGQRLLASHAGLVVIVIGHSVPVPQGPGTESSSPIRSFNVQK